MSKHLSDADLAEAGVDIAHFFGGGAYVKETQIPSGTELTQHAHAHDHLSYLAKGRVALNVDGEMREVAAPSCLTLPAGKTHGVYAITDAVWLCIWATDCTDSAHVDEELSR